jgi:hypothetical protein
MSKGWAQKATVGSESRYRLFYYRHDAVVNQEEWMDYRNAGDFKRDFYHNFKSLDELGVKEG